jgi:hypothetical protein
MRPGYDALAEAEKIFHWMDRAWTIAGVSRD